MKVMPNRAMTTVTTADSKYSRQTLFGGPCTGAGAGGGVLSWPLRLMRREKEKGFASVEVSPVVTLLVVGLLAIKKHPRYVASTGQVSAPAVSCLTPNASAMNAGGVCYCQPRFGLARIPGSKKPAFRLRPCPVEHQRCRP